MPETTETTTVDRPATEVFAYLADFEHLDEWDPTFTSSRRVDEGSAVGLGTRYAAVASVAGQELELELEIVEFDEPHQVVLAGRGDGLRTTEDIKVSAQGPERCEVTYHSRFETERSDLLEAAMQPGFTLLGKAVMRRLGQVLDDGE